MPANLEGTDINATDIWSSTSRQYVSVKNWWNFNDMLNVLGIVDDILVVGYDDSGRDHDEIVQKVLQRCREVNLKLNKDKCHFRCTSVPFFKQVISQNGVQPDLQKFKVLIEMPPTVKKSFRLSYVLLTIETNSLQAQWLSVNHFKI